MATRSTIALEYEDGTVRQVYCHWDGYLSHNGQILLQHYTDKEKVENLIDLGDLSSLAEEIGEEHDMDSLEKRRDHEDWCKFYGRDRGEADTEARVFDSFKDYKENHQYEEFEYILRRDGLWWVSEYGRDYKLLEDAIADAIIEEGLAEDE